MEKISKHNQQPFRKQQRKGQSSKVSEKIERTKCDCEATSHELVNNCTFCGRIVCKKEGAGPCLFCGNLVDYENLKGKKSSFDKSSKNYKPCIPGFVSEEYLKKRDQLLENDRNCTQRTSVIDDECDYYKSNNTWISEEKRKNLKEQESRAYELKHGSRMNKKINVDLFGRVCSDEDNEDLYDMSTISNSLSTHIEEIKRVYDDLPLHIDNLMYTSDVAVNKNTEGVITNFHNVRVQDENYLEILDNGLCLSLHQPHASLLVAGIKIVEGRTWYSPHRGRLWIASASKEPSQDEIKTIEAYYEQEWNGNVNFPKCYPVGCLLGCVTVVNVLPQEEFQKLDLQNKNDSPYIFICDNFFELPIKYPIEGKHKIFKLDSVIHRAALNTLEKVTKKKASIKSVM